SSFSPNGAGACSDLTGSVNRDRAQAGTAVGVRPALAGLALVVAPLLALLPRVHWATFWSDISEPSTFAPLTLSTKCALLAVVLCVVLGVPLALVIARAPAPLGVVLRTIVTLPLVLPPLVGGVALLAVLGRTGLIGPW